MKTIYTLVISLALVMSSLCVRAQNNDLNLNGMATFEQLRKEYYIGALYLGWPGRDPAAIANMPGKKRLQINITADRWPSLRFSQMWNQAITINNPSAFINANALDILAFTSLPKGDLVEGDRLTVELTSNNTTQVSINGFQALRTNSPALFTMLLNAWIGPRPPTSEFKRDILDLPKDQAGNALVERFESIRPNDARKKVIAGWGFKAEPEKSTAATAVSAAAPVSVTTPVTATATPTPTAPAETAAAPTVAPKKVEPAAETVKPEAPAKPVVETKPNTDAKPNAESKPTVVEAAKPAPVKPTPAVAPPVTTAKATPPAPSDTAIAEAKIAHSEAQDNLLNNYFSVVRKEVLTNIQYPRRAVKESIEGLVMMRIKVDRSGGLSSVEIAQSADDLLDAEAERAVKKAAPFPKPADALEGNNFEFIVPIVFKLTQ